MPALCRFTVPRCAVGRRCTAIDRAHPGGELPPIVLTFFMQPCRPRNAAAHSRRIAIFIGTPVGTQEYLRRSRTRRRPQSLFRKLGKGNHSLLKSAPRLRGCRRRMLLARGSNHGNNDWVWGSRCCCRCAYHSGAARNAGRRTQARPFSLLHRPKAGERAGCLRSQRLS